MAFEWLSNMFNGGGGGSTGGQAYNIPGTEGLPSADPPVGMGRGQPGSGVAPDKADYNLNYNGGGQGIAARADVLQNNAANQAANLGQSAQGYGSALANQAGALTNQGQATQAYSQNSANPLQRADYTAANQALSGAQQNAAAQGSLAQMMQGAGQTDASAAQAQLQAGTNNALDSAMSIAKSGGGFGGSAAAMAQAAQAAPSAIANQANQSAMLRSQEAQANAGRQLQALGMSGQQLSSAGGQQLQAGGLLGQMAGENASLAQQGINANNQRELGLGQLGLGYNQAGMQGSLSAADLAQSGMQNAYNSGFGAQNQALNTQLGGQNLELQGALGQQQGMESYNQGLNDLYGIDTNYHLGSRQLVSGEEQQQAGGVLGALSAVAGLF